MRQIPIPELAGRYFATEDGKIVNKQGMPVKPFISSRGYMRVKLHIGGGKYKNYSVHVLVAMAFIPNPDNLPQVNHKDGNKLNPAVYNLEWCNQSYNTKHAIRTGLYDNTSNQHKASIASANKHSIAVEQLDDCGNVINTFRNKHDAASALGISNPNNIKRAILTGCKCGGYHWRKAGD